MAEVMANKLLVIFAITVTPSNTAILNEHTVNHIFQYPNGEAVHQVIKNFEDFQKIQNHVGPGPTPKEIVEKISKLEETGGSRCKQWSEIKIGKSRNTTLAWRKIIHITQKD